MTGTWILELSTAVSSGVHEHKSETGNSWYLNLGTWNAHRPRGVSVILQKPSSTGFLKNQHILEVWLLLHVIISSDKYSILFIMREIRKNPSNYTYTHIYTHTHDVFQSEINKIEELDEVFFHVDLLHWGQLWPSFLDPGVFRTIYFMSQCSWSVKYDTGRVEGTTKV